MSLGAKSMAGEEKRGETVVRQEGRGVRPFWPDISHVKPIFADQLQITRVGDVYHLTFGQVQIGDALKEGQRAAVEPVVRVVASKEAVSRMINLLENVRKDWVKEDA
jgi:hypothetical protein